MKEIPIPSISRVLSNDDKENIKMIFENQHKISLCLEDIVKQLKELDRIFYK